MHLDPIHDGQTLNALASLSKRAHPVKGPILRALGLDRSKEIIYQNIVRDVARLLEFSYVPFPVKAAANYSLLYLMYRTISETDVNSVLELGVGESTLFLNRLRQDWAFSLTSLEHDPAWLDAVNSKVSHTIQHCPLEKKDVAGARTLGYDFSELDQQKFDFVIVDGPNGTFRRSRWGVLEILERNLKDEFVLLFDDAHRKAEQETIFKTVELLQERRDDVFVGVTFAAKAQALILTGKYRNFQFI